MITVQSKTPTIQIAGISPDPQKYPYDEASGTTTYTMRHLSVRDTFALTEILATGARASGVDLKTLDISRLDDGLQVAQMFGDLLFNALAYAEDELVNLMASLLGVNASSFADGQIMPMGSEITIIQALVQHPDAAALFKQLGNAIRGKAQAPAGSS